MLAGVAEKIINKKEPYYSVPLRLIPSFVCHVDILGYSQLSKEAISSGNGDAFLSKLRDALSEAYSRVRERSEGWSGNHQFSIKVFTDNIVLGYPVKNFQSGFGEVELGQIFSIFSEFQVGLAMAGFLVRGGIAFGGHYMDDDIVFGDALIEAVKLDSAGGYFVNCSYPAYLDISGFSTASANRLIGFQANASSLSHSELEGASEVKSEPISEWTSSMRRLNFGIRCKGARGMLWHRCAPPQ